MYCYSYLEDYIKNLYYNLKIYHPADLKIKEIANQLKIKVFYWSEKSQALFIKSYAFIFICSDLSPQGQWQDFIHELCHVLLHEGKQMKMAPLFRNYQEAKAKNFTYHACVPTFMLQHMELPINTNNAVRIIQETFNVEYDFAMARLTQYINNHIFYERSGAIHL